MKKWVVLKAVYDEGNIRDIGFWKFDDRKKAVAFINRDYRRVMKANDLTDETCMKHKGADGKVSEAYCATSDGCFQVDWVIAEDK